MGRTGRKVVNLDYKSKLLTCFFGGLLTLGTACKDQVKNPDYIGSVNLGGVRLEMYADTSNIIYAKYDDKFYPVTLKEKEVLFDDQAKLMKDKGYAESDWTVKALPVGDIPNDSLKNTNFVKKKILEALENAGYADISPKDISIEVYYTEDDTLLKRELREAIERSDTVPPPIVAASELFSYGGIYALIKTSGVWNQLKPPKDDFESEDDDFFGPIHIKNDKGKWNGTFYTANIKKKFSHLPRSNLPR